MTILEGYRTRRVENLFAQSSASYVLHEMGEAEENFPRFDPALSDKVTMSAYSILAAGVSLAEEEISTEAIARSISLALEYFVTGELRHLEAAGGTLNIAMRLGQVFDSCGFHVSHLYGGFRVSAADRQLAEDYSITIATPEKDRAILRSSPELFDNVKLIVVDEGHLIGANERLVRNELFPGHLRFEECFETEIPWTN